MTELKLVRDSGVAFRKCHVLSWYGNISAAFHFRTRSIQKKHEVICIGLGTIPIGSSCSFLFVDLRFDRFRLSPDVIGHT